MPSSSFRLINCSVPLLALGLFAAGCTADPGYRQQEYGNQFVQAGDNLLHTGRWQQIRVPARTNVHHYLATEGFHIPANTVDHAVLRREIEAFFATYGVGANDTLVLDGLRDDTGKLTPEAQRATEVLRSALTSIGYRSTIAGHALAILNPVRNNAALIVRKKVIFVPDCSTRQPVRGAVPSKKNFGCSQEANLARMVASPEYFDGSTPMSQGDGVTAALGTLRYRAGEVIPLEETLSTQGVE